MARGPKAAAASAISRDPRMRGIPNGVPRTASAVPGAAARYSGGTPAVRSGASMMRYSGHTNPLAKR